MSAFRHILMHRWQWSGDFEGAGEVVQSLSGDTKALAPVDGDDYVNDDWMWYDGRLRREMVTWREGGYYIGNHFHGNDIYC